MMHFRFGRVAALALLAVALMPEVPAAQAQTGDTNITVRYTTRAVRVRPQPHVGTSTLEYAILLQPGGKVSDRFATDGRVPRTANNSAALGDGNAKVSYRVANQSTITRTTDMGSYVHRMVIRVSGKGCTASASYNKKPGFKEMEAWSAGLGQNVFFSSIQVTSITCSIQ